MDSLVEIRICNSDHCGWALDNFFECMGKKANAHDFWRIYRDLHVFLVGHIN